MIKTFIIFLAVSLLSACSSSPTRGSVTELSVIEADSIEAQIAGLAIEFLNTQVKEES